MTRLSKSPGARVEPTPKEYCLILDPKIYGSSPYEIYTLSLSRPEIAKILTIQGDFLPLSDTPHESWLVSSISFARTKAQQLHLDNHPVSIVQKSKVEWTIEKYGRAGEQKTPRWILTDIQKLFYQEQAAKKWNNQAQADLVQKLYQYTDGQVKLQNLRAKLHELLNNPETQATVRDVVLKELASVFGMQVKESIGKIETVLKPLPAKHDPYDPPPKNVALFDISAFDENGEPIEPPPPPPIDAETQQIIDELGYDPELIQPATEPYELPIPEKIYWGQTKFDKLLASRAHDRATGRKHKRKRF